jgi:DNA repair exonuclease SbcCD ATPase subunit
MIKSLKIKNFQIHKKLLLEFDSNITVIIGPSDTGKSAILRALRWLFTNKPSGDEYIHHDETDVSILLKIDNHKIIRSKGSKGNRYLLDGKEYKSFGSNVPTDIQSVLNIGDVNFQGQIDPPWWFLKSPGEVSKELNSIVNLGLIDRVMQYTASELRKNKIAVEISKEKLKQTKDRKKGLGWVKEANVKLGKIEKLYTTIVSVAQDSIRLRDMVKRLEDTSKELKRGKQAIFWGRKLDKIGQSLVEIDKKKKKLDDYVYQFSKLKKDLCQENQSITAVEKEISKIKVCPVCKKPLTLLHSH